MKDRLNSEEILIPVDREAELDALADVMRKASGAGLQVVNALGTPTRNLLAVLPGFVTNRIEKATISALDQSFRAAAATRGPVGDAPDWLTRAMTLGTGGAAGMGGLPAALAEIPVTTTVILRAIQGIASAHGFDPERPDVRDACLSVFAADAPLDQPNEPDLSFLTMRMTTTGLTALIARVAPRLSVALGQKVAAQAVPVLGVAVGAATNYVYTAYYQDIARIQFGLMRLSEQEGQSMERLVHDLKGRLID